MALETLEIDAGLEAHCRRVAAWSLALEDTAQASALDTSEIIELAEALDQHFAWEPFGDPDETANPVAESALGCLQVTVSDDLDQAIRKLPVFPAVAQRALRVLAGDDWSASELESIVELDQVLAAHVLRAANSWVHGASQPVASLARAFLYLGAERTARIVYAASVMPMFSGKPSRAIWLHSIEAAQAAEAFAEISRGVDPKEAFLAGLVHDIGRLAMSLLPAAFRSRFELMTGMGCEMFQVERILTGFSHSKAGARALLAWGFSKDLAEAVEFHHQPERSVGAIAALLFLVEYWTDAREDVPSLARLQYSLRRLGLTAASLNELPVKPDRSILALA
jgi:putative nucleotidyltransferase with HDIG domain